MLGVRWKDLIFTPLESNISEQIPNHRIDRTEKQMIPAIHRPVVLASGSPRRASLLRQIGLVFEVRVAEIEESPLEAAADTPDRIAVNLAEHKARWVAQFYESALIIGADTVVSYEGKILGKPADQEDARRMLALLSGNCHQVYTGVTLILRPEGILRSFVKKTDVYFRSLTEVEIERYLRTHESLDKAGAYGIQGKGALLVSSIRGDYANVVGLPLTALYEEIRMLFDTG